MTNKYPRIEELNLSVERVSYVAAIGVTYEFAVRADDLERMLEQSITTNGRNLGSWSFYGHSPDDMYKCLKVTKPEPKKVEVPQEVLAELVTLLKDPATKEMIKIITELLR